MKPIVKTFNNLIKKTIFKVQNKTNSNFKISNFNKYLITLISLLFFYLFYLLIPILYEKSWVQASIETKLLNEFKINLSTSSNISYRILPSPHFLFKDSKILLKDATTQKTVAEVKNLKVFLSQKNFFNKEKLNIKEVIISDANFSLIRNDLKLINKPEDKKISNKKIKVNNSNIFFKNNLEEIISIIKIDKAILFFDNEKVSNFFELNGEVFNIPFTFNLISSNESVNYREINFKSKSLKLNIFDKYFKNKNNLIEGKNIITFLNSTINTKYNLKENLIIFRSDNSKIKNSEINYHGELSINPFDLDLNISLNNHKISKLFNISPILAELIKSKLLFNDNISVNTSLTIHSNSIKEIFQTTKIDLQIINGKIDLNNTRFVNEEIGSLILNNSNLFFESENLMLNTDIFININNSDRLFSSLNTSKTLRKNIKNIIINLDYNFSTNQIEFNNIKIDNRELSDKLLSITDGFNDNNDNNFNKSRRLINELLFAFYEG